MGLFKNSFSKSLLLQMKTNSFLPLNQFFPPLFLTNRYRNCGLRIGNCARPLWCWRRLLRVPWTARRSKQSILKEISPEYSLEGLMLKLKLQYFGHLMRRTDSLEKTLCWERLRQEKTGRTEDEMVGWNN